MWLICIGCHHHAEIKPLKKGAKLVCSACGSRVVRAVRQVKLTMLNGGQIPADMARLLTYAGLISIASHRGYKRGWAAMKYRTVYGSWPQGEPPAENPSPELSWWVRQETKAYAKLQSGRQVMPCGSDMERSSRNTMPGAGKAVTNDPRLDHPGEVEVEPASGALMADDDWEVNI